MKASYLYIVPKTRGSRLFSAVRIMCSVLFLSMVFDDELNKRIEEPLQKNIVYSQIISCVSYVIRDILSILTCLNHD